MVKNIGHADKWVRIVVGVLAMLLSATKLQGWFALVVLFFGIFLIGTAIMGGCYFYERLGVNTRKGE